LVPPVDDLFDLDPIRLEAEPPRRFIGLVTGVAFNFDKKRFHGLGAPGTSAAGGSQASLHIQVLSPTWPKFVSWRFLKTIFECLARPFAE
jgi:hypothetical protein